MSSDGTVTAGQRWLARLAFAAALAALIVALVFFVFD